ncbi:hypothetical protein ElyMa_006957700 [Elysia marginata]|uniref:DUF7886 domain-containing protein n=1 Tax=Elysia marginata TaxID=1093978 RepID=A0AAV4JLW3_9GAST|nr:hypothetical protein ElyMa_006957700 [Elysia marginata]
MMDASAQEMALKKKLQVFLSDLQLMGTVVGFKHFTSYVRGREEMVLAINNSLQGGHAGDWSAPASRRQSVCPGDSLTSSHLPYDKGSLVLSHNTQLGLSGRREKGIGLPPASPAEEEIDTDNETTLFLVAGYARYSCPYVWVRSNHERLFKLSGDQDNDRDSPLRLKSTAKWKDGVSEDLVHVTRLHFQSLRELTEAQSLPVLKTPQGQPRQRQQQQQNTRSFYHRKQQHQQQNPPPPTLTPHQQPKYQQPMPPPVSQQQQQYQQQPQQQQPQLPPQGPPSGSGNSALTRNAQGGVRPPPRVAGYDPNHQVGAQQTFRSNQNAGHVYGRGPRGAFPGGFDRMPAPSLF